MLIHALISMSETWKNLNVQYFQELYGISNSLLCREEQVFLSTNSEAWCSRGSLYHYSPLQQQSASNWNQWDRSLRMRYQFWNRKTKFAFVTLVCSHIYNNSEKLKEKKIITQTFKYGRWLFLRYWSRVLSHSEGPPTWAITNASAILFADMHCRTALL